MPCNLNFNQCITGCSYPRPIFTCFQNFISLFNQSGNTIVNPVIEASNTISEIATPQTVAAGGNVIPTVSFSQGSAISYDNAGTFTLINGRYLVSYNLSGVISANGLNSYAIYLDGNILPASAAVASGTIGSGAAVSGSTFVQITAPTGAITIRNTNSNPQLVNSGSVTIQKIN